MLFQDNIYLQCLVPVAPDSSSYRVWFFYTEKASRVRCLTFAPYAWRRFTPCGVMRCGRGLRTTHYIVRPRLTVYAAKICSFSLFQNLYLSTSTRCIKMGIESLKSAILYNVSLYFHCHLERSSHCHFDRAKQVEKSQDIV